MMEPQHPNPPPHPDNPNNDPEITPGEHPGHIDPNRPERNQPSHAPNRQPGDYPEERELGVNQPLG